MKPFSFLLRIVSILVFSGVLAACSDDPELPLPHQSQAAQEEADECERAVLVYMLADNSLGQDGYDRQNLSEMIQAAADGLLHGNRLIVYHDDRKAQYPMLKEVTPQGLKILKVYENEVSSASASRMEEAIADFKSIAPAKHYGLIFWSHATGWPLADNNSNCLPKPMWAGDDKGNYMDISDLHNALSGNAFDYIYFDCCFMASVEALYELRDAADYFVASAAELPAEGMPYYQALPYLMSTQPDLVAAAQATFTKYNALSGASRTSTISVINANALDDLAAATQALYDLKPTLAAGYQVQRFERTKMNREPCYLFDFKDYIDHLESTATSPQLQTAMAQWNEAIERTVIYKASTPWIFNSIKVDHHCGLTTFILTSQDDALTKGYCNYAWFRDVASSIL